MNRSGGAGGDAVELPTVAGISIRRPALMAGNAALLKHSPDTTGAAWPASTS
jgi:acyl-CoA reductase-like NAD-dependent aldehyde dehydrogenase